MDRVQATSSTVKVRKRKAESHDNERLSKRLSLLNLERDGQKLYVPVEQPAINSPPPNPKPHFEDVMQLDNSKHKVYIYDIDAELSDSGSESDSDGKLVFLPDIQKHLKESRIPPSILANQDGELAGNNLELVLYNVPSSLTIPEEQDSVRKAIIETRARARAKQEQKRIEGKTSVSGLDSRDWFHDMVNGNKPPEITIGETMEVEPSAPADPVAAVESDPDAMDLG